MGIANLWKKIREIATGIAFAPAGTQFGL